MPLWDYRCENCNELTEKFFSRLVEDPPCDKCGRPMSIEPSFYYSSPLRAQRFSPVVIHRAPDGAVRFPGRTDAPVPAGFERVELTTIQDVRRFEKEMNTRDAEKAEKFRGSRQAFMDGQLKENRRVMDELVKKFSPRGRKFYDTMREMSEKRQAAGARRISPEFVVDAFSYDSSNREEHYDERSEFGRRGGRK